MKIYKKEKIIAFYSYRDYLSNHFKTKFNINGLTFYSVEQAMMYFKAKLFNDEKIMKKLLKETHPPKCKLLGREVSNFKDEVWNKEKYNIVERCNFAKFNQNPKLKYKLLDTINYTLVEASPRDIIWGVGLKENDNRIKNKSNWRGDNLLGKILMDVRKEIFDESFLYKEIKYDVFNLPRKYYIVHSVSKDGAMGKNNKGKILPCFATEVLKRYPDTRSLFLKQNPSMPDTVQTNRVFNLVTKNNYWNKPKYQNVELALIQLKNKLIKENIKFVGMPRIESGMNKLEWLKIKKIIINIFKETNIKIVVCYL